MANTAAMKFVPSKTVCCLLCLLLASLVTGCPSGGRDEGASIVANIRLEDFGTGVMLLQTPDAAKAAGGFGSLEKWVLSREELIGRNPYEDKPDGKDLIIAITSSYSASVQATASVEQRVVEIRVFPDSQNSQLSLQGQLLVELSPAAIEELFGKPLSSDQGSDSNTHLSFLFIDGENDSLVIRLITSHSANGRCYAASFAIEPGK